MRTSHLTLACVLVVLACGCHERRASDGSAEQPSTTDADVVETLVKAHSDTQLVLVLRSRVGSSAALRLDDLEIVLVNDGTTAVRLVQPGDGSEVAWRTPILRWAVALETSSAPLEFQTLAVPRCGNMNMPRATEVFTLAPGERRSIEGWILRPQLSIAGRYRIALEYENDPDAEVKGLVMLGPALDSALAAFRETTPCVVRSTSVVVEVP